MNLAALGVPLAIADSKEVMVEEYAREQVGRTSVRWVVRSLGYTAVSQSVSQAGGRGRGYVSFLSASPLRTDKSNQTKNPIYLADLFPEYLLHAIPLHTPCFPSSQGISRTAMTLDEKGRRLHGRLEFFDRNVAQLIRHISQTVGHHQGASLRYM